MAASHPKSSAVYAIAVVLAGFLAGCYSPGKVSEFTYAPVAIAIVDRVTGAPISGVTVTTEYWGDEGARLPRISSGETDTNGLVILQVCLAAYLRADISSQAKGRLSVIYRTRISNEQYEDRDTGRYNGNVPDLTSRGSDFKPSSPDFIFELTSRETAARQSQEAAEQEGKNQEQAQAWFDAAPDYWPEPEGMWADRATYLLIDLRWDKASETRLGTEQDLAAIQTAVIAKLPPHHPSVDEVRWLDASTAMITGSYSESSISAAVYRFVARKEDGTWKVIRSYLLVIS